MQPNECNMAFILPTAVASGQISVSRRRRQYEFLQTVPAPASKTSPTTRPPTASPNLPHVPDLAERRAAAMQAVAQRLAERQAAVAADAKRKAEEWHQLMLQLRSDSIPKPSPTSSQTKVWYDPSASSTPKTSSSAPPTTPILTAAPVPKPHPVLTAAPVPEPFPVLTPAPANAEKPAPSASQKDDTTVPQSQETVQVEPPSVSEVKVEKDIVDAAEKAVKSVADVLKEEKGKGDAVNEQVKKVEENPVTKKPISKQPVVGESVVESVPTGFAVKNNSTKKAAVKRTKSTESKAVVEEKVKQEVNPVVKKQKPDAEKKMTKKSTPATSSSTTSASTDTTDASSSSCAEKSLGAKILDAISEGIPTMDETAAEQAAADRAEVVRLVENGNVKKLTVTKLRRLLSANGLKTSGRKSELIARLTSFAKS